MMRFLSINWARFLLVFCRVGIAHLTPTLIVLATAAKAGGLTFDYSRTVSVLGEEQFQVTSNLTITGASNIHFIDGINNKLEVWTPLSSPHSTGNIYFVNGINNNLQLLQSKGLLTKDSIYFVEGINNQIQTSWFNLSSPKNNLILEQKVTFNTNKNIYFVDGINNNIAVTETDSTVVSASSHGNVYFMDGINNRLRSLNLSQNTHQGNIDFSWGKSLVTNPEGISYWSSRATIGGANNVYLADGFNNIFQALSLGLNNTGNDYIIDGINNQLQVFNTNGSLLEDFEDNRLFQWSKNVLFNNLENPLWSKSLSSSTIQNSYKLDGINQRFFTLSSQDSNLYSLDGINNILTILPTNLAFLTLFNDFMNSLKPTDYVWEELSNPRENNPAETKIIPEPSLVSGLVLLGLMLALTKPNLLG